MRTEYQPPPSVQRQIDEVVATRARAGAVVDKEIEEETLGRVVHATEPGSSSGVAPLDELVAVPFYDTSRVAGVNALLERGTPSETVLLSMSWLRFRLGGYAENLAFIHQRADDLRPTIYKDDLLLLDLADTHVSDGYYVVAIDNWLFIQHLQRDLENKIWVIDENGAREKSALPKLDEFPAPSRIVARVISIERRL